MNTVENFRIVIHVSTAELQNLFLLKDGTMLLSCWGNKSTSRSLTVDC